MFTAAAIVSVRSKSFFISFLFHCTFVCSFRLLHQVNVMISTDINSDCLKGKMEGSAAQGQINSICKRKEVLFTKHQTPDTINCYCVVHFEPLYPKKLHQSSQLQIPLHVHV